MDNKKGRTKGGRGEKVKRRKRGEGHTGGRGEKDRKNTERSGVGLLTVKKLTHSIQNSPLGQRYDRVAAKWL